MKIQNYTYPNSSFLSMEKDLNIIVDCIMKNDRLKKLLYYTTPDCLNKPNLTQEQSLELFGKNIKIVPKIEVDGEVLTYIIISFKNFLGNQTNPEFRNNTIEFDIVCHLDQWALKDFELRPYKIAAEIDTMFKNQRLTGVGNLEFIGATSTLLTDEFGAVCVIYEVTHGEEDSKNALNPEKNQGLKNNFDKMFNV